MAQNISKFVPEIYSKKLLRDAKQITDFKNVMCNFDWEGEIKNFGDTVRICSPNADLVQIGEGVVPNPTNVTPNQLVLTIDKTKNFMFYFNDIEQAQSQFKMMEGYMNIGLQKLSDEVWLHEIRLFEPKVYHFSMLHHLERSKSRPRNSPDPIRSVKKPDGYSNKNGRFQCGSYEVRHRILLDPIPHRNDL